jgi:hypothetical protein
MFLREEVLHLRERVVADLEELRELFHRELLQSNLIAVSLLNQLLGHGAVLADRRQRVPPPPRDV